MLRLMYKIFCITNEKLFECGYISFPIKENSHKMLIIILNFNDKQIEMFNYVLLYSVIKKKNWQEIKAYADF